MQEQNSERVYVKFDEELNLLIIEVTEKVAFVYMRMIRKHLWPEVEHMESEIVDVVGDTGKEYKSVRRYIIPVYKDRVEFFFDAAKHMLAEGIKKSIPNSDN